MLGTRPAATWQLSCQLTCNVSGWLQHVSSAGSQCFHQGCDMSAQQGVNASIKVVTACCFGTKLLFRGACFDINVFPLKLCCQCDMGLWCSCCAVMPDGSRIAINMLKLLMFCHSLAATDLAAANLATQQHQFSLITMSLGPVGLRMKIVTRCDAP